MGEVRVEEIPTMLQLTAVPSSFEELLQGSALQQISYPHKTENCKRTTPTADAPVSKLGKYFCVPCNKRGHWAGWSGCPTYIHEVEIFKQRAEERKDPKPQPQRPPAASGFVVVRKKERAKRRLAREAQGGAIMTTGKLKFEED